MHPIQHNLHYVMEDLEYYQKLENEKIIHPKNFIPIPDSVGKYSTGNSHFDDKLEGGFKKGSVIAFEIDESVDRFVFVPLFSPLILNFLSHNNSSIIVSPTDQDTNSIMKHVAPYLAKKEILENLKIIGHSFSNKSDSMYEQNDSSFDHIKKEIMTSYSHSKQKNKPTVLEMDCSLLELTYHNDLNSIQNSIVDLSRHIRSNNDLLVLSSRPGYNSSNMIKSLSDLYFRIFSYEGNIFLSAEKPQLFLANIQTDFEKGYPCMELVDSS